MYSSTSPQSHIYRILFLVCTIYTDVISSPSTLNTSISSSSILITGTVIWDDILSILQVYLITDTVSWMAVYTIQIQVQIP